MQQEIDWNFTFVFCASILGFVVSGILYFTNKNGSFSARILAAYLLFTSYACIHFNLTNTNFFLVHPHFWRTAVFASFSVPALGYLYVRNILYQQIRFKWSDLLFFLPALIFTLSMLPFYLQPASEKIRILQVLLNDRTLISTEPEGLLPQGWGFMARMLYGLSLAIAQYILLFRFRKTILAANKARKQNIDIINWLTFFTITLSLTFFILLVETSLHISRYFDLNRLIIFTISCNILFITGYLLVRPNIMYGLSGWLQPEAELAEPKKNTRASTLSNALERSYQSLLDNHLNNNKPFLKTGYKIADLSEELNIPIYQLSAFINQEYGKNFNELINDYRVNHLIHLMKTSPDFSQYTLEALGKKVGFNSRSTFIDAVKKNTGQTPTDYFGKLRAANAD